MKYIVKEIDGREFPILFEETIDHSRMAKCMGGIVVSAGFCYMDDTNGLWVQGKSVTLKIGSREDDKFVIKKHLRQR